MDNVAKTLRHYIELVEAEHITFVAVRYTPTGGEHAGVEQRFEMSLPGHPDDNAVKNAVRGEVRERATGQSCKLVWQRVRAHS